MPLYEFSCDRCEREFEVLVRGADVPECPACGNRQLERLLSVPAAHVSGTRSLPVCPPTPSAGCGLPQCGSGRCQFDS